MIALFVKKCRDCDNLNTNRCPIRVWERNEGEYVVRGIGAVKKKPINPSKDYCSRFIKKEE